MTAILILAAVATLAAMAGMAKYILLLQASEKATARATDEQIAEARRHLAETEHELRRTIDEHVATTHALSVWLVRNENGSLFLSSTSYVGATRKPYTGFYIDHRAFPEVTTENSPVKAALTITL